MSRLTASRPNPIRSAIAVISVVALVAVLESVAVVLSSGPSDAAGPSPGIAAASPWEPGTSASFVASASPEAASAVSIATSSAHLAPTNGPVQPPTTGSSQAPAPTLKPPTVGPTVGPTMAPTRAPTPRPIATPAPTAAPTPATPGTVVSILAAGDVRSNTDGIMATTKLIQGIPGLSVLNVGDDSANGTAAEYTSYFDPAWGQFKSRIFPTPGNHEYNTAGAAPYFAYYGSRAGTAGKGWYSFDFTGTSWHVVELNGNLAHGAGSAQETWLRRDLAANAGKHIVAFWHEPRFSSGTEHGSDSSYTAFWNDLYAAHADIVLNGHDHDYERFALQNGAGGADPAGIREFVVGMGGTTERTFGGSFVANSQAHNDSCWGVLKLTLRAHSYDWQFVPVAGGAYHDSGTQATHS